ncbi:hypothetical protein GCM10011380_35670 [Sphingomonas metalli]|uniref:Uncharacterized protein n=1 Tax=Sphingomonas metalli TaxID=1779358 RepID=A0A916TFJ8_9SPHN|nr:hypothetical protein GCM10011380_35670 [Sphingomonas metalli]
MVGHSAGASIALALANRLGDTVQSLLLVDPSGDMRQEAPDEAKRTDAFLAALRSEEYGDTVQSYWRGALRDAKPATAALDLIDRIISGEIRSCSRCGRRHSQSGGGRSRDAGAWRAPMSGRGRRGRDRIDEG